MTKKKGRPKYKKGEVRYIVESGSGETYVYKTMEEVLEEDQEERIESVIRVIYDCAMRIVGPQLEEIKGE